MKNWIKLFEDEETAISEPQVSKPHLDFLKKALKGNYQSFVSVLGKNVEDPKFIDAINYLTGIDRVDLQKLSIPVFKLIPTQNEIDITKSLAFPLTNPNTMMSALGGGPIAPGGPIITSGGGKYVIDGHHRWSQIYVCNPRCEIEAFDMSDIKGPFSALKATQLGIAAATGTVPTQHVEGTNLLNIEEAALKDYVIKTIKDEVLDAMKKYRILNSNDPAAAREQAASYLWKNVNLMQQNNQPVDGAPPRGLMPQTDTAKGDWFNKAPNPETTVQEKIQRLQELSGTLKQK